MLKTETIPQRGTKLLLRNRMGIKPSWQARFANLIILTSRPIHPFSIHIYLKITLTSCKSSKRNPSSESQPNETQSMYIVDYMNEESVSILIRLHSSQIWTIDRQYGNNKGRRVRPSRCLKATNSWLIIERIFILTGQ